MNNLVMKKTEETPAIIFMPQKGVFQIVGNSWPEDATKFYDKILDWLDKYFLDPLPETVFQFRLVYYNTASSKQIIRLLGYLKEKSKQYNVKVQWYYNKNDIENSREAERYRTLLGMEDVMEVVETDVATPSL